MPINHFRKSRKHSNICKVYTSLTEETEKSRKTGASLVLFREDTVRHGGRCPAAHTETDNVWSSLAALGHAG